MRGGQGVHREDRFQTELRRALLQYALTPIVVVALLGSIGVFGTWHHYVTERSSAARTLAGEVLCGVIADYQSRTDQVVQRIEQDAGAINQLATDNRARADLYSYLYHEVNITHDGTGFYLLDASGQLLLGSQNQLPEEIAPFVQDPDWGLLRRLTRARRQGTLDVETFVRPDGYISQRDIVIGSAICSPSGEVSGYFCFIIPCEYLQRSVQSPYLYFVLTNEFSGMILETGGYFADDAGHLRREVATLPADDARGHIIDCRGEYYYASRQVLDGTPGYSLYALMPISNLLGSYLLGTGGLLLLIVVMLPVLAWGIRRESQRRSRELRDAALDEAQRAAEVRELEARFRPHFLFNTLENIRYMVRLDPTVAMHMIKSLSQLLRYSIDETRREVVLADDLHYLAEYIYIQQRRYGSRLRYTESIAAAARAALVPRLLVQPILENAMKYGADAEGNLVINMTITVEGQELRITVGDGGGGFTRERLHYMQELLSGERAVDETCHTGIYNIHRRLQLLYGGGYGVTIYNRIADQGEEVAGAVVQLRLPYRIADGTKGE